VVEGPGSRWVTRPWLALGVRIAVFAVPLGASLLTVEVLRRALPASLPRWATVVIVAVAAILVATAAERLGRRLLPLSSLLDMTLLFPDRAPSRLRVFRNSVSTRQLQDRLADPDADAAGAAATTLALITALGGHDRRTRGHSERVRVFADLLADEVGLADVERDRFRWAALLHDIGKLQIAAAVLNKPGKLDAGEWDLIRSHPLDGVRIVGPLMDWLGEWGGAIPEHHERYDGTGYPLGLAGTGITRSGRMVAVVDAFETMTAARSYKQPMNTRAARAELARCAGTHFDPQLVRAFLNISLPRLLWAMGPLAMLVHLPFLRSLEQAGSHVGTAVATASGATVLAVGATVVPAPHPAPQPRAEAEHSAASARTSAVDNRISLPNVRSETPRPSAAPTPTPVPGPTATPGRTGAALPGPVRAFGSGTAPAAGESSPAEPTTAPEQRGTKTQPQAGAPTKAPKPEKAPKPKDPKPNKAPKPKDPKPSKAPEPSKAPGPKPAPEPKPAPAPKPGSSPKPGKDKGGTNAP
jgi:putative nucleotidyltransferase with HDIG domain